MTNPIIALANVKRRLAHRTAFKPGPDPVAVASSLRAVLAELAIVNSGRACLLPRPVEPESAWSPAKRLVMQNFDRIGKRLKDVPAPPAATRRGERIGWLWVMP